MTVFKSLTKLLLGATCAACMAGAANAADAVVEEAVIIEPGFTWTGLYIGANVGYSWGDHTLSQFEDGGGPANFIQDYDSDGFIGGVFAGYNWQYSQFVYGIEGDVEYTDIDGGFDDGSASATVDVGLQGSLRARVGVAFDRFMVYGTGGVAFADIDYDLIAGTTETLGETAVGWTIGGGAEAAVTDQIFVRAEYRYTDFGTENFDSVIFSPDNNFDQDTAFHTVRLGVGYKF
jgi:outer membrane immunogenic protein